MDKKSIYQKSVFAKILSSVSPLFFTLAVGLMMFYGLSTTEKSSEAEGIRILRESLLRTTVKCYAVEGRYPESLSYIENKYNIHIDRSKYVVDYEIFASNIMPSIKVMELKKR